MEFFGVGFVVIFWGGELHCFLILRQNSLYILFGATIKGQCVYLLLLYARSIYMRLYM